MLQIKSVRKTFNETVILQEISLLCERGNYGIMDVTDQGNLFCSSVYVDFLKLIVVK